MRDTYSLYEAKAKLSAIIRRVGEGRSVVITVRGKPVAELRPAQPAAGGGLDSRLAELAERGILVRPRGARVRLRPAARRSGALARFLADRDM